MKGLIQNILLLCCSLLVSYLLAESIFYFWEKQIIKNSIPYSFDVFNQREYDNTLSPSEGVWLPDGGSILHIRSNNPVLVYELRPNARVGNLIYINSYGFRDKEFSKEKDINTFRILVIGDSISFGWGLKIEDTYPKQLEQMLNVQPPCNMNYEVLNLSVGGYNALQEAELLKTKALQFYPNLVIIGFCTNDFFIGMDAGLFWHFYKGWSPLLSFIKLIITNLKYFMEPSTLGKEAYSHIATFSTENKLPVLVCLIPSVDPHGNLYLPPNFIEFLESIDLPYLDLTHFLQNYAYNELFSDGLHLTPFGHQIIAETLYSHLVKETFTCTDEK